MADWMLRVRLVSDATFGRGDGVAGLVDAEIEHDTETGLPYMRGRQLKGLLVEECANILFTLEGIDSPAHPEVRQAAQDLFGRGGSVQADNAKMHIGHATLPERLIAAVKQEIENRKVSAPAILDSLTTIRRQTAMDYGTGTPEDKTLRSMRVLLRETQLTAPLTFDMPAALDSAALVLLGACAAAVRRAGTGRNRGRGRINVTVLDAARNDLTPSLVESFAAWIGVNEQ